MQIPRRLKLSRSLFIFFTTKLQSSAHKRTRIPPYLVIREATIHSPPRHQVTDGAFTERQGVY